jgi:hypothetical protein
MNPAIVGGVIVVVILLVVFYMLSSGGEEIAPAVDLDEETKAEMEENVDEGLPEEQKKEEGQEESEIVKKEVPKDAPEFKPNEVEGLVAWYDGSSYDEKAGVWKDKSAKKNDATEIRGEPEVIEENGVKYVIGGKSAGIRFPQGAMTTGKKFTMIGVARYQDLEGGRIFDGYGGGANWLSGFHWNHPGSELGGRRNGAHRSGTGWIAGPGHYATNENVDDWILSVDQKHLYRFNGVTYSGLTNNTAKTPTQMSINHGDYTKNGDREASSWACAEVMFFENELDLPTIHKLENYLFKKYKILKQTRVYTWNRNYYRTEKGWLQPFGSCSGADCAEQLQNFENMGGSCGDDGAVSSINMNRHWGHWKHKWRNHQFGPNGLISNGNWYYDVNCLGGLENGIGGEEKKTDYISTTSSEPWQEKWKTFDMNCRNNPISAYKFEASNDKSRMRLNYKCSNAPVIDESCRDIKAGRWRGRNANPDRNPADGPFSSLDYQHLHCGSGQVLTKVEYGEDDAGNVELKGRCCTLEDL